MMHSSPVSVIMRYQVTVHTSLSREVFWHEYAKIPRHTSQNSIAAGNLEWILATLLWTEWTVTYGNFFIPYVTLWLLWFHVLLSYCRSVSSLDIHAFHPGDDRHQRGWYWFFHWPVCLSFPGFLCLLWVLSGWRLCIRYRSSLLPDRYLPDNPERNRFCSEMLPGIQLWRIHY